MRESKREGKRGRGMGEGDGGGRGEEGGRSEREREGGREGGVREGRMMWEREIPLVPPSPLSVPLAPLSLAPRSLVRGRDGVSETKEEE